MLSTGDLSAVETAGGLHLDAQGSHAHGAAHGILHGPAEGDALLQLLSNVFGHQLGVDVGVLDLHDLQVNGLAQALLQLGAELLDLLAALADNHTGTGAVHIDTDAGVVALDLDLGHAGGVQTLLQLVAELVVLYQEVAHFLIAGIPTGVPVFDDTHAQTVGIHFLSHAS